MGRFFSIIRLALLQQNLFVTKLLWISGLATKIGILHIAIDLAACFPQKRRGVRHISQPLGEKPLITVALTAYNDELSIALAVDDFLSHPLVKRVIVVSNNSKDRTVECGQVLFDESAESQTFV